MNPLSITFRKPSYRRFLLCLFEKLVPLIANLSSKLRVTLDDLSYSVSIVRLTSFIKIE